MYRSLRTLVLGAAAAASLLLAAAPVHGQLGGVLRRAAGAAGNAASAPAAGGPNAAAPRAERGPVFDEHTLEITGEVLGRFVAGLNAEAGERARMGGDRARAAEMRAHVERFERCQQREGDARGDRQAEMSASANTEEVAMRIASALMRGDTATHRRLMDSLMVAAHGGPSQCGERPTTAYAALRRLDQAEAHVAGVAADAGRFTVRQFATLRERIAPWVLLNGAEGGLTPDERRVLEARRAELARHGELLRAGGGS